MSVSLSVVIPVYNRADLLGRTIASVARSECIKEIVLVDDHSTDGSAEVCLNYPDARVRLIRHEVNQGEVGARNTGLMATEASWAILLDSDDEMLVGGIEHIASMLDGIADDVVRLLLPYRIDTGGMSPVGGLPDDTWDYADYLRWLDEGRYRIDALTVVRVAAFRAEPERPDTVRLFHLDLSRAGLTRTSSTSVGLVHSDANVRLTDSFRRRVDVDPLLGLPGVQRILSEHGEGLRRHARRLYAEQCLSLASLYLLMGNRRLALAPAVQSLVARPFRAVSWAQLMLGMIGPGPLRWIRAGLHKRFLTKVEAAGFSEGGV